MVGGGVGVSYLNDFFVLQLAVFVFFRVDFGSPLALEQEERR